jgi:signal transduction histidine kinase
MRRRQTLLRLHDRALAGAGLEALARHAATATTDALAVPFCGIFELTPDGRRLHMVARAGSDAGFPDDLEIDAHVDTQAGYALVAREPVIVADAETERRFSVPAELAAHGARSGIAVRFGAKQPHGVLVAYAPTPRTFDDSTVDFAYGVAAIIGAAYERRRLDDERVELVARDEIRQEAAQLAARRAAFLAQTAMVLDAALDPDMTLVSLARLAVPAIADCAVVDGIDEDGRIRRIDVVDIDPVRRPDAEALRRMAPDLRGEGPFGRAIRTGQPVLLPETAKVANDARGDAEQLRLLTRLGCQSLLLIPLVVRGQTLALLTLGSRLLQRYDGADLSLAQELAGRAAMAIDNGRLHREAEAASRAKDEFLATVSHELRTPLNAVLGWAALLRMHPGDEARTRQALDAIDRSVRAQLRLVDELLDVSRIVSGRLELHISSVRLAEVIDDAVEAVRPAADERRIRIEVLVDSTVPPITGDASRLRQVAINLLSNALKFSPEEGLVAVELRRADERSAELLVTDHGIGISPEFLPHVFERFRQSLNGRSNQGLGLGLSIARDIVERHGGAVTAESAGEGRGATFRVLLPLGAPREPVEIGRGSHRAPSMPVRAWTKDEGAN